MGGAVSTPLAVSLAIPIVGGLIISEATKENLVTWYRNDLHKPWWNPPGFIFGPVWTILYGCMGTAAFMVWEFGGRELGGRALSLYAIQLALNFLWPLVFFNAKRLGLSVLVNIALLVTSAGTCGAFYKVNPEAGKLLLPYLAWLVFAVLLNYSVWRMNPGNIENVAEAARRDERARQEEKGPLGPEGGAQPPPAGATAAMAPALARRSAVPRMPQPQRPMVPRLASVTRPAVRPRPAARMPTAARAAAVTSVSARAGLF